MAHTNGNSLADLERQAEARRAELAQTVDELHNRVSPGAIKADMKSYARDTGQHMLHLAEDRARDNPLAAAAIAAGIAYPLWRMIGKMPAPVLLIGAGLALSMRGNGSSQDLAMRRRSARQSFADEHDDYPEQGPGGSGLKETIGDTLKSVKAKVADAVDSVRETAASTTSSTTETLSSQYRTGREAASVAAAQLNEGYHRTRESVLDTVERHPFLVGGLVFAVGSLVALSLPATRRENRLMGEASDGVKRQAREFASEGMNQAEAAARRVVDSAVSDFREEGLTPELARKTARTAMDSARDAGSRAMRSGGEEQSGTPSSGKPGNTPV